jgi:hypothetical protein
VADNDSDPAHDVGNKMWFWQVTLASNIRIEPKFDPTCRRDSDIIASLATATVCTLKSSLCKRATSPRTATAVDEAFTPWANRKRQLCRSRQWREPLPR